MGFYIASAVEKGAAALRQCDERTDVSTYGDIRMRNHLHLPSPDLVEASCGATVLIHDASHFVIILLLVNWIFNTTFDDGMVDEAITRNHSTTKEAVFSQRYPKIPLFYESHMHKTCIAFDMMSIKL
nr:zinc phosphodiesterase ELAC protein 2 [Ipomoea batatas]